MRVFITAAAAAGLALGGQCLAEEGSSEGGRRQMRERILERFDADGDGELSEEERAEARSARERMRSQQEGAGQGRKRGKRGARGPEGRGERGPEGRRGGPEGRGSTEGRRPPSPDQLFRRFDADGDDQLSRDEFGQFVEVMRQRMQGNRSARGGRGGSEGSGEREFGPLPQRRGDFRPGPPGPSQGRFDGQRPPRGREGRPEFGPPRGRRSSEEGFRGDPERGPRPPRRRFEENLDDSEQPQP